MIKLYCNSISHLEKFNPLTTTYIEYRLLHPHNFEGWYLKSNSSFHFSISEGDIFELCIFLERLRRRKCIVLPKKLFYTNIPWLNWFPGSLMRWTNVIFLAKTLSRQRAFFFVQPVTQYYLIGEFVVLLLLQTN